MKTARKIPRENAARKPIGFAATAVGSRITAARVPPVISTAIIPATIAQTIVQRSMTTPLPNAKPQPTMRHLPVSADTSENSDPAFPGNCLDWFLIYELSVLRSHGDDHMSSVLPCVNVPMSLDSFFKRIE